MTTQTDYHRDEWDLILGAPGLVALVIIESEQWSQAVAYQKLRAVMPAIHETAIRGADGALIQAVLDAIHAGQSPLWTTECPHDLGDIRLWALDKCRQLAAILAQKAPEAEADAYVQWLIGIGQRVALAPDARLFAQDEPPHGALDTLAAALGAPLISAIP